MKRRTVCCMAMALMLTGCAKGNSVMAEAEESVDNVSTEVSVEMIESDSVQDEDPDGVYSRICRRKNYEGNDLLEREFIYCFRGDGTGLVRNDICFPIRWADGKLYVEPCGEIQIHEYILDGDVLKVKEGDSWEEYTKKPGGALDLVLNGDLSEFAGTYKATDESNSVYGGGKALSDIKIDIGGMIIGDGFPQVWPSKITETANGSYLCEYDDYDLEYAIYPEGKIDEKDTSNTDLLKNVYIRVVKKDSEDMEAVYYRTSLQ